MLRQPLIIFLFVRVFSNICGWLLTLQTLPTISCVKQLMSSSNTRSNTLNLKVLSATCYLSINDNFLPTAIKDLKKCQEIFIFGYFNRVIFKGLSFCIFFSILSVRHKAMKI